MASGTKLTPLVQLQLQQELSIHPNSLLTSKLKSFKSKRDQKYIYILRRKSTDPY